MFTQQQPCIAAHCNALPSEPGIRRRAAGYTSWRQRGSAAHTACHRLSRPIIVRFNEWSNKHLLERWAGREKRLKRKASVQMFRATDYISCTCLLWVQQALNKQSTRDAWWLTVLCALEGVDFVFVHSFFLKKTLTDDRSGNCRPTAAHTRTESDLFADAFAVVFAHLWLFVLTTEQCPEVRGCSARHLRLKEEQPPPPPTSLVS